MERRRPWAMINGGLLALLAVTLAGRAHAVDGVIEINEAKASAGFGLNLNSGATYSRNSISANTGSMVSAGVAAGQNVCDGSLVCP